MNLLQNKSNFILCPFHKEKTPSFSFNLEKKCYHCFGCGVSGNLYNLLKKINIKNNIVFDKKYNLKKKNIFIKKNKLKILKLNNFIKNIFFSFWEKKRYFFIKRKIKDKTINKFNLGYSDYNLLNYVILNYSKKILLNTGVFKLNLKKKIYNIFYNRIIFPIKNIKGNTIGYAGRNILKKTPKYINSYNNFFFKKKKNLYGIYETKKYIINSNYVIIVEGYIDVIYLYQKGFKNTLGLMGSSINFYQIKKIYNLTKNFFICFDNDVAGILGLKKSIIFFLNCVYVDLNIYYIILPKGFDPDNFLKKFGKNKFKEKINKKINIYDIIYIIYIKNIFKLKKNITNNLLKLNFFLKNINNLNSLEVIFFLFLKNKKINLFYFFLIIDGLYEKKYYYKYVLNNNFYKKILIIFIIFPQIVYFFDKEFLKDFLKKSFKDNFFFLWIINILDKNLNFFNFFLRIKSYNKYIFYKSIFLKFYKKKLKNIFLLKFKFFKFIKNLSVKDNLFYKKNIKSLCDILYIIFLSNE